MIRWLVHNCVAHPLLGVATAAADLAALLHDITAPASAAPVPRRPAKNERAA